MSTSMCVRTCCQQYRFIGDFNKDDAFVLDRIIRADWLSVHHDEAGDWPQRTYRAFRTGQSVALEKVEAVMEIPQWPSDVYKERENHPDYWRDWGPCPPPSLRQKLLPIYDICDGNSLPENFHQMTVHAKTNLQEYLYIDVPNSELRKWALLGNLEKDWERGGSSLLDIQAIAKLPLEWGEAIAYRIFREADTGMLGIRPHAPDPDPLIRGQHCEALEDIKCSYTLEDEEDFNVIDKGDTLIIDHPSAEPDEYRVYKKVSKKKYRDGREMIFQNVPRSAMRPLEEVEYLNDE